MLVAAPGLVADLSWPALLVGLVVSDEGVLGGARGAAQIVEPELILERDC